MWLAAKRRINHVVGIAKGDDAVEKCNVDASPLPHIFNRYPWPIADPSHSNDARGDSSTTRNSLAP